MHSFKLQMSLKLWYFCQIPWHFYDFFRFMNFLIHAFPHVFNDFQVLSPPWVSYILFCFPPFILVKMYVILQINNFKHLIAYILTAAPSSMPSMGEGTHNIWQRIKWKILILFLFELFLKICNKHKILQCVIYYDTNSKTVFVTNMKI